MCAKPHLFPVARYKQRVVDSRSIQILAGQCWAKRKPRPLRIRDSFQLLLSLGLAPLQIGAGLSS